MGVSACQTIEQDFDLGCHPGCRGPKLAAAELLEPYVFHCPRCALVQVNFMQAPVLHEDGQLQLYSCTKSPKIVAGKYRETQSEKLRGLRRWWCALSMVAEAGTLRYNWSNVCMQYFSREFLVAAAERLAAAGRYHIAHKSIPSKDGPVKVPDNAKAPEAHSCAP